MFDIGGTITLMTPLRIREPRITIAGQTAPGGGLTLRGQPLLISTDDVVVRHIRSRLGDEQGVEVEVEADAITIDRGTPDLDPLGPRFEFTNNVFYNWSQAHAGYNADSEPATVSTYVFAAGAGRIRPGR